MCFSSEGPGYVVRIHAGAQLMAHCRGGKDLLEGSYTMGTCVTILFLRKIERETEYRLPAAFTSVVRLIWSVTGENRGPGAAAPSAHLLAPIQDTMHNGLPADLN